jgi:arsenate reductase-like glutaredoxin family protein
MLENASPEISTSNKTYICNCGKSYNHDSSYYRHKKTCKNNNNEIQNVSKKVLEKDELIVMLIKENSEFKSIIMDQQNMMMKVIENGGCKMNNSNNTTNSYNKAFNLNFFLNETCKNAMNITDFVDSIKLQLSDFINVGEVGFIEGITNIIVKNLNSLDETIRPIHCTDQKRETFYVKDENKWEKEEDKKRLKKMIKKVAFENEKLMKTYKETYPDYNDPNSKHSDQYSKTVIEAMDNKEESREKIIKNISKATIIKQKL